MPFNLSEEQLQETESILGSVLPNNYRESMKRNNGGEASTENDDWEFYPIYDSSDKKRISRTCNHIIKETESLKGYSKFPQDAVAIAGNGVGDQMVFLKKGIIYCEAVYMWFHETGEVEKLAENFSEINKS